MLRSLCIAILWGNWYFRIGKYMIKLGVVLMMSMLIFTGCQQIKPPVPTKYNGNFNTIQIRGLWMMCLLSFRQKNLFLSQDIVWKACDCYTDVIRQELTPEQVEGSKEIIDINLQNKLIERCNPKIVPPIHPT